MSCDTVFYDLAYDIWKKDHVRANDVTSPKAPFQEMQEAGAWNGGFGRPTGVDLSESSGTVPSREWLYYFWKDNAHAGQNWCMNGKENGSYVQQIEWEDCRSGNVWTPGQSVIASIGQGYVSVTPLQLGRRPTPRWPTAARCTARGSARNWSARPGRWPSGSRRPKVAGHLPASAKATLAWASAKRAAAAIVTQGTAEGAFGGFPLSKVRRGRARPAPRRW